MPNLRPLLPSSLLVLQPSASLAGIAPHSQNGAHALSAVVAVAGGLAGAPAATELEPAVLGSPREAPHAATADGEPAPLRTRARAPHRRHSHPHLEEQLSAVVHWEEQVR